MKILIINGSPKGKQSNTLKLARAFADGFSEACSSELEELTVRDLDIRPCLGCFSCWRKTPGKCVLPDDMAGVLEKLVRADLVLWSFGLYYFSVPGKLKLLIDRQLPLALPFMDASSASGSHPSRFDLRGQRHVLISTCGFFTAEGNYQSVTAMFDHFLGKGRYETIFCGQGELFRVPELRERTDAYLAFVKKAGREYAGNGIQEDTRAGLGELLYPREVFEAMADASWGIEKESGQKEDPAYVFTRQMAALYNRASYAGRDRVLQMDYTDIGKCYQVVLKKDGYEVLKENFLTFTTRIVTPLTVWQDIAAGKISGQDAMMRRLYRVEGDFDLMLHWDEVFGAGSSPKEAAKPRRAGEKGPSFLCVLLPWITFWAATAFDRSVGAYLSIGVCAAMGIIFLRYRKTLYDAVSAAAVLGLSAALLADPSLYRFLLPTSYLLFGLLWSVSCLLRVPLTAWYSMKDYNGDKALENPLFLRTNRILTLAWGVLYLLTGLWTFFLMGTPAAPFLTVINNILPVFLGLFTAWFQRWYPAHYAAKAF